MAVLIKRYANRKLYNTDSSRYITLKGISELVREGKDICVIDNETGEEITPIILSQILVDDQKQSREDGSGVPGRVLTELVSRSSDALYKLVRRSMDDANQNLNEVRDNIRKWVNTEDEPSVDLGEVQRTVHDAVERVLRVADLPTRADLEALNKNLERLSTALSNFERQLSERSGS
ncbi:MAG: hypothetical protein GY725_23140 [bacterium]|nr:hypothetical protein [bacterium]